jgi:serine/threonine protein kinase
MSATAESYATEGEVIGGKFRIGARLAVGSMGVVVAARHLELDESVAIKVLHPNLANPRFTARFIREARNAARIKSEHVPRFIDVGWLHGGLPYLVMEYLEGHPLSRVIATGKEMAVQDAVDCVLQACEAVAAAHITGILHRDLKPSNLFLTTRLDGSPLIKVLDFGVSRALNSSGEREDEGLTVAEVTLGSHDFKAPEQMVGRDVDGRCDVWALGAILYYLLTRRPPFVGKTSQEVIKGILAARPRPPRELRSTIPSELEAVIMRCLQLDREARPASVAKLALFLQQHASERTRHLPMSILKAGKRARRVSESPLGWEGDAVQVARDLDAPELYLASDGMLPEAILDPSLPRPTAALLPFPSRPARTVRPPARSTPTWFAVVCGIAVLAAVLVIARMALRQPPVDAPRAVQLTTVQRSPDPTAALAPPAVATIPISPDRALQTTTPASSLDSSRPAETATPSARSGIAGGTVATKLAAPRMPPAPTRPRPASSSPGSSAADPWGWER